MYFKKQAQINNQIKVLFFNKASTEVLAKYSNYSNIFSIEYPAELPDNTRINKHTIKLEGSKQPLFGPIYSLGSVELKTLKTYIKINLANGFIRPSKSLVKASILFNRKSDRSLCFCINYWGLNNLTIKN